ncbi:MAG: family 43 glycosylhydrolase, partial [Lachnospiraceae bacterium]|nr:family 43 glycosylhydrolase [Lachnospiraceae bacterium]
MYYARNPILPGFCPDPSICRVEDDYYIVTSSFAYFPGVPIYHSKDLAHWEQIGHVLTRESQLPLNGCGHSEGIFAPVLRYHKGTFYMITTNISGGGNFIVTADKPEGPWSEPYFLGDAAKGIDPSLYFEDDADGNTHCYYIGTRPNSNGVSYNGDWEIWLEELDLETMQLRGDGKKVWKGAMNGVIWPEGPHLYKKDGFYLALLPIC